MHESITYSPILDTVSLNFSNSRGQEVASKFGLICIFLRNKNNKHIAYVYRLFRYPLFCSAYSSLHLENGLSVFYFLFVEVLYMFWK